MTTLDPDGFPVPSTPRGVWSLVPDAIRAALRARVPLDAEQHGTGAASLLVAVGCGAPLRMLQVETTANGACAVRLYEWRKSVKELASTTTNPIGVVHVLARWAKEYGLGN